MGIFVEQTDRAGVRAKSMNNHAQKYLAQANRQIAELAVQVASQRVIVKHALDTGQRSEMAESLLDALEGSLRIFEKHRELILRSVAASTVRVAGIRAPRPATGTRRAGTAICIARRVRRK